MLKVFSYGGGVQSTAALVLAVHEQLSYSTFIFANVGKDSENPATLEYIKQIAKPYAKMHRMDLIELERIKRGGSPETIYGRMTSPKSRSIGIPVYMANGVPGRRQCTVDFKIKVVAKWLKQNGATSEEPATVALGISLDEWHRMRADSGIPHEKLEYPLIDLRLDRAQCIRIIERARLPVPPKSSCWFCPFHSTRAWQELRQNQPDLFAKAVELEQIINARRSLIGKDQVWLSSKLKPLERLTTDMVQGELFEEEVCESGYCFV